MQIRVEKKGAAIVAGLLLFTFAGYARVRSEQGARGEASRVQALPGAPSAASEPQLPTPAPLSTVSTGAGELTLSAELDRSALLRGGDNEVHVALKLHAAVSGADAAARKPTDAVVVLDISGSMAGQKLEFAKQALHTLIDRLAPADRFALVTYESTGRIVVPLAPADAAATARFHRVVDSIDTAGGTNISAGLDLARSALAERDRGGRNARVVLLSDGNANEGDTSLPGLSARVRQLVQQDDVLSAMGVGDDFNEDVMASLADTGTGNFYYLSRVALLGRFFDAELRAAAQTVASALELRFTPAPGVELVDVSGYPVEREGDSFVVRPGSLYAGQERLLWATVRAPREGADSLELGAVGLRYKRDDAPREVPEVALPALARVADPRAFERSIATSVWEEYVATEHYQKAQAALGKAIGTGDAADIAREQQGFESNRGLAEKLGSTRVLAQLAAMVSQANLARAAQNMSASERTFSAKQMKSRALFERRKDAYNDDPKLGL